MKNDVNDLAKMLSEAVAIITDKENANIPYLVTESISSSTLTYFYVQVHEKVRDILEFDLSLLIPRRGSNMTVTKAFWLVMYYGTCGRVMLSLLIWATPFGAARRWLVRLSFRIFGFWIISPLHLGEFVDSVFYFKLLFNLCRCSNLYLSAFYYSSTSSPIKCVSLHTTVIQPF